MAQTHEEFINAVAAGLDEILNGDAKGENRKVGFALLTYEFGQLKDGRVNYIGNGNRADVKAALKELLARWDGTYSETSTKQ